MKNLILTLLATAGSACADIEVISDQVEPTNLSFPKAELRRYLAAYDCYAHFPKGFFHRGLGMPSERLTSRLLCKRMAVLVSIQLANSGLKCCL